MIKTKGNRPLLKARIYDLDEKYEYFDSWLRAWPVEVKRGARVIIDGVEFTINEVKSNSPVVLIVKRSNSAGEGGLREIVKLDVEKFEIKQRTSNLGRAEQIDDYFSMTQR